MDELNLKQLTLAVRTIADEKNLSEEIVLSVIEQAIAAAWRRDNGERDQEVRAELNTNDGTATVYVSREVVEAVGSEAYEISLEEAKKEKADAELGDLIEEKHEVTSFGRVAAQTAKQVVLFHKASKFKASFTMSVAASRCLLKTSNAKTVARSLS